MSKTLIGIVTFGGLEFTKLAIRGIRETVTKPYDICAVVGKPGDSETALYLNTQKYWGNTTVITHGSNRGFPASLNDIYDVAWKTNNYDNLIMMGNDVIPYPYAIDS